MGKRKHVPEPQPPVIRAPLLQEFTVTEKLIVALVARGHSSEEIAKRMHLTHGSAKIAIEKAKDKIPGDLPGRCRILFWLRGATVEQLTGDGFMPLAPSKRAMGAVGAKPPPGPPKEKGWRGKRVKIRRQTGRFRKKREPRESGESS